MSKQRKGSKLSIIRKFIGEKAMLSVLLLIAIVMTIGCPNTAIKPNAVEDQPYTTQSSILVMQYWFVESNNDVVTCSDFLAKYLMSQGEKLDIEALRKFVEENIGYLKIIEKEADAIEFEGSIIYVEKEVIEIECPDGSVIRVVIYR